MQDAAAAGPPTADQSPPVAYIQCVSCTSDVPDSDAYKAHCEHDYCDGCLDQVFNQALIDERFYPPRCCQQDIPYEDVRDFLSERTAQNFAAKKPELDDPKRIYCHVQTCSAYIPQDARANDVGRCPTCPASTCLDCKGTAHDGDCPENEATKLVEELAARESWRRCPSCRRMVELRTGCNHMTCLCKTEFCYICGSSPWMIPDPLRPGQQKRSCNCDQFDEHRILERAEEIVQREGGGNVRAMAEHVREHHDCEGLHNWGRVDGGFHCDGCNEQVPRFIMRCRECRMQRCYRCTRNL
ncbi:uncharacterized protein MYCFIDRAFT_27742 [Pseudocercospora fijiensis CIRAD86]|uniref:RBR-type E3 ubiquitin transferase n=1 Tax=Pseudocercospora fijiensis (strain CIRAD86) TaxID=383855 RepID=N1QBH3_PSEFD|nr:uncharacterized protein MYCFIDRAFT_27742 [Pseudocercospora fijiensis CIRAD86]EME89461.1 hypothetical protein MYCFIDRAFT_27742 [Pseudocercospora fijiensis CIRAD86]